MVAQQITIPDVRERTFEENAVMEIKAQEETGLHPAWLASLNGPNNVRGLSLGQLNNIPFANLPFGYPFGLNAGIPPALQAHLLMGRPLLNAFSGLPNTTRLSQNTPALAQFAPGIQALQGNPSQQHYMSSKESGMPSATEIKEAIATLAAAAAAPTGPITSAPIQSTTTGTSQTSLPTVVFMECDRESLSDYQCLLRKQIELFEASAQDVQWNAQGRNKPIVLGQVGIRCRWCANLPTWSRSRGAVYYSATLDGLYQAAQNMAKNHICKNCRYIPADASQELTSLRECKRRASGGKKYWAEGAKVLGVYECEDGLRFKNSKTPVVPPTKRIEIEQ
ncbi:unnamed protein product [Cylindrotheca closterium]|uniref:Uncharacterized protein n=1 Tax=Cylindrotheca closterium TaxID=2856 RepID=A0AAD2G988_9STRA|nr:unnamed protein product [Cylindrotheca closterium]